MALIGLVVGIMNACTCSELDIEFKFMKSIEKAAAALLLNPKDEKKVEAFKVECKKLTLIHKHYVPFALSGAAALLRKPVMFVLDGVRELYVSYSIVTFLLILEVEIVKILSGLASIVSRFLPPQLIEWPIRNPYISFGILLVLSLYYDPIFSLVRESRRIDISMHRIGLFYLETIWALAGKIIFSAYEILSLPIALSHRKRVASCDPFVDPLTLPQIIQRTLRNVEGKNCDVTRWGEKIGTEAEVDRIRRLTLSDETTSVFLRFFARFSKPKDVLKRAKEMELITYVGIHNKRCVLFAVISYDPIRKIRRGRFFWDTPYLKKEFLLIYEKEAEKQRVISRELPSQLEELIRRME